MISRMIYALMAAAILLPCTVFATDSGPSNTVGFWKLDVQPGFTQISFPLLPDNKALNNVLSDQLTGGATVEESDQIIRWNPTSARFQIAWYNSTTSQWAGEFSELSEAEAYWVYVQPDHPAVQTIVAYGNVIEEPTYNMGAISPGYNAVGSVWAMPTSLTNAGMSGFQGGVYLFLSDLIMSYDAASGNHTYAWKNDAALWQGNLTEFEPCKGYWVYIAPGHPGFNWTYPQPGPTGLDSRGPGGYYPDLDALEIIGRPPMPTAITNTTAPASSAKGGAQ
ncbi:MAG: hypothetical protein ABIE92_11720 [bacterium]|nr:hypothetical protein [bacterium]